MLKKLLTDNKYIHELSIRLSEKINVHFQRDGIEKIKLQYGLEIILIDISKLLIVLLLALLLGTVFETIVVVTVFNIVRFKAYGVHAKTAAQCLVGSIILFVALPYAGSYIEISNITVLVFFIFVVCILAIYSPADTENTPILGKQKRRRFKIQSIIITCVLLISTLVINSNKLKTLITLGAVIEAISLLPITYKFFGKSRNNYEKYEKQNSE